MAFRNLTLVVEGRVSVLTVNRPEVRNALDTETVQELHRALDEVRKARSTVLIVTGAGDKAFISGADINAIRQRKRDDALASINSRLMSAIECHDAVSIAADATGNQMVRSQAPFAIVDTAISLPAATEPGPTTTNAVPPMILWLLKHSNKHSTSETAQQLRILADWYRNRALCRNHFWIQWAPTIITGIAGVGVAAIYSFVLLRPLMDGLVKVVQ